MKNKVFAGILVGVLGLTLAGCASNTEGGLTPQDNPNKQAVSDYSLSDTPQLGNLKIVVDESKLPSGYELQKMSIDPDSSNVIIFSQDTPDCRIQIGVNYAASYYAGWGDEFITKNQVWGNLSSPGIENIVWKRDTVNANDDKTVEVVTASWDLNGESGTIAQSGGIVAYRFFDVLKPNGYDPEKMLADAKATGSEVDESLYTDKGPYGSSAVEGLPGFSAYYTCTIPDAQPDATAFEQVLKAVTLQGLE